MKETVTLLGKEYQDVTDNRVISPVRAYIQCSWFSPAEMKFMEAGLQAIAANPTVSLKYSHHPLNHPYKGIDVNAPGSHGATRVAAEYFPKRRAGNLWL